MRYYLFLLVFLASSTLLFSQNNEIKDSLQTLQEEKLDYQSKKNMVKLSLTSLAFRNFQFQYERALNKTFSLALSYSFIPNGDLPMKGLVEKYADDPELNNPLDGVAVAYSSFTPEVRIYLGEGYGKGFYLAPFFRTSKYTIENLDIDYELDSGNTTSLATGGSIKTNTFGLLLGAQFNIGKSIVLDWWIMGPHYGSSNGSIEGISPQPLSEMEQQVLLNELEDIDIPLTETKSEVSANGAKIKIDGPWGGIKAGVSIGYRF